MKKNPVSSAYARALLELASERNRLNEVAEEIQAFLEPFRKDRDFRNFILTPSIDRRDKKASLDRIFSSQLSATLLDFLKLVLDKGRQGFLEEMLLEYSRLFDQKMNRAHVEAVTAVAISPESEERLAAALAQNLKKTIVLEKKVRPEVLGGMILRHGDLVVDGSVRTHLQKIHGHMQAHKLGSELVHEN
ncbi:MAG: ATP synthase F1 subunit delta [Planctomycetes bacterium]|nr:ATP synthase F1 subunit delta [Planctomycetota bacterium]